MIKTTTYIDTIDVTGIAQHREIGLLQRKDCSKAEIRAHVYMYMHTRNLSEIINDNGAGQTAIELGQ